MGFTPVCPRLCCPRLCFISVADAEEHLVLGDKMKALAMALGVLFVSPLFVVQDERSPTLGEIMRWPLHTQHGDVLVKLSSSPKDSSSHAVLALTLDSDSMPSASEEAVLLRQVLRDMSLRQYDPRPGGGATAGGAATPEPFGGGPARGGALARGEEGGPR